MMDEREQERMAWRRESPTIVVDMRCLQDPHYTSRGVGRHALTLLRHAPPGWHLSGLVDPALPALLPAARAAVQSIYINAYAASGAARPGSPPAGFITLSPMTHDPLFSARLLTDPNLLRVAVVYDFIPWRHPDRYLPGPAQRLEYANRLRWLARCDLFAPISKSAARDLMTLLGVPERSVAVTGCPLAPGFENAASAQPHQAPRHLLVVGGGDARKNPEVVIRAHARSGIMQRGRGIPLVVAGGYSPTSIDQFRAIAAAAGGRADLIEVPGHVPDEALVDLYGKALAVVSASRDEGFSIPVIEGMAAGVPCLVSDIPAHAELVPDSECRFPADDDAALLPKLERLATDAGWRTAVVEAQATVWPRFRAPDVGDRFWNGVRRRLSGPAPAVRRGYRPRIAMMSPLPPDRSGVADYTAATCEALGRFVELHVFTETANPTRLRNVASVRLLGELPHLSTGFDRAVSVVGNSHFHTRIFELLQRHGGACIAHDARMLLFYRYLLGQERALAVASKELGRLVTEDELNDWLDDEGKLETLFLSEIAESASPTIVHSPVTARMFAERYGTTAIYLPFSIYHPWSPEELTKDRRTEARRRLGLEPNEIAIATFGFVHANKAPEECVWALEVLRGWGIPATLHFVGQSDAGLSAPGLGPLVEQLGLTRYVRFAEGYVSDQMYRDYLIGADLAVQLRTYGFGGLSGGLLDCAAAGLPAVTNQSLGAAVGVPDYIRCIPDAISPLLLAEALADLLAAGMAAERPEAERRAFSEQRSMDVYARHLCQALGFEPEHDVARPAMLETV
ncbi:glycosyltransferase [Rhodopila globiformis]|nr:glycosyltransferase [Rhodopila globiformis]